MFRRIAFGLTLVVLAFVVSGCVVAIGNSHPRSEKSGGHAHDTDMVIAEIDAAGKLFSDGDKTSVYKGIAGRKGLSSRTQAYLVKESCRHIFSDSSKEEVMIVLIDNPCFDDAGKRAVLSNLGHLFSDSRKKRVLEAMNDRENRIEEIVEVEVEVVIESDAIVTQ